MPETNAAPVATPAAPTTTPAAAPPAGVNGTAPPAQSGVPLAETPPATEPAAKPKKEVDFTARFAALTEKERELTRRETALKERISAAENFETLKARAKKEPTKVMEELGVSYEYLTKHILSGGKAEPEEMIAELREELSGVKTQLEDEKKEAEKKKVADEDAYIQKALDMYKGETTAFLSSSADEYQMIVAKGAQDEVFSLIENWFFEFGEVLTPKAAADKVETALLEEAQKLLKVPKLASLLNPTPPAKPGDAVRDSARDVRETSRPSPTLTNDVVAHEPVNGPPLTREQRLKRSAALLRYTEENPS